MSPCELTCPNLGTSPRVDSSLTNHMPAVMTRRPPLSAVCEAGYANASPG
ncbi:hypothetical protein IG631_18930 [Alternaria alternata]|nr:hypothetical protein IG631_18930 [Alternaria alternata]